MRTSTCLAGPLLIVVASAQTMAACLKVINFDPPEYTLGSVVGQQAWLGGQWGGANQTVTNQISATAPQSLEFFNPGPHNTSTVRCMAPGFDGAITPATPMESGVRVYIPSFNNPDAGLAAKGNAGDRQYTLSLSNDTSDPTINAQDLGISVDGMGRVRAGTSWLDTTFTAPVLYQDPGLLDSWFRLNLIYNGVGATAQVLDDDNVLLFETAFHAVNLANANSNLPNGWEIHLGSDGFGAGSGFFDSCRAGCLIPAPSSAASAVLGLGLAARRRRSASRLPRAERARERARTLSIVPTSVHRRNPE